MSKSENNILGLRRDIQKAQQEAVAKLPRPPFHSIHIETEGCQDFVGGLTIGENFTLTYKETLRLHRWMTEVYGKDLP